MENNFNSEGLFILGSSRSGTTLLHKLLQQLPMYSDYQAEPMLLYQCRVKYGNLNIERLRKKFLNDWYQSRQFRRSKLTQCEFEELLQGKDKSYANILKRYMELISSKQMRDHWIDSTPANSFVIKDILNKFPNSKIIHMVRDGRAVSLSLAKLNWAGIKSSNFNNRLCYAALKWESSIQSVHSNIQGNEKRILEIKYEDLVTDTENTLNKILEYLECKDNVNDIHYDISDKTNDQSYIPNNSAFGDLGGGISPIAAYRWKNKLNRYQISLIEYYVGNTLNEYGYKLESGSEHNFSFFRKIEKDYRNINTCLKKYFKEKTLLGRFSNTPLELGKD